MRSRSHGRAERLVEGVDEAVAGGLGGLDARAPRWPGRRPRASSAPCPGRASALRVDQLEHAGSIWSGCSLEGERVADDLLHGLGDLAQHRPVQRLLAAEAVQQAGLGVADRVGDLLDRGVLEAVRRRRSRPPRRGWRDRSPLTTDAWARLRPVSIHAEPFRSRMDQNGLTTQGAFGPGQRYMPPLRPSGSLRAGAPCRRPAGRGPRRRPAAARDASARAGRARPSAGRRSRSGCRGTGPRASPPAGPGRCGARPRSGSHRRTGSDSRSSSSTSSGARPSSSSLIEES